MGCDLVHTPFGKALKCQAIIDYSSSKKAVEKQFQPPFCYYYFGFRRKVLRLYECGMKIKNKHSIECKSEIKHPKSAIEPIPRIWFL